MRRRQRFPTYSGSNDRAASLRRWSYRLAWVLCCATALLLFAGAMVTSTGSSLAVPDWPLAYGQLFPPMVGGILYEHGHRMVAASVGLLTIIVMVWLWRAEPRRWVRWMAVGMLCAVIVQGVLGGLTVLFLLPKPISISHAMLAEGFFMSTVALVQILAPGWEAMVQRGRQPGRSRLAAWATVTWVALLCELLIGAVVRHFNAGLAIATFPLAYGHLIPPLTSFPIEIHFAHRVGAVVVALLIALTIWQVFRHHRSETALRRPAIAMGFLVVLQIALGGTVIWTQRAPTITSLHVVNGALLIATAALLTLRAWVLTAPPRPASHATPVESSTR